MEAALDFILGLVAAYSSRQLLIRSRLGLGAEGFAVNLLTGFKNNCFLGSRVQAGVSSARASRPRPRARPGSALRHLDSGRGAHTAATRCNLKREPPGTATRRPLVRPTRRLVAGCRRCRRRRLRSPDVYLTRRPPLHNAMI